MPDANGWLSDDEQEAIWDGWAEMYQAQDEALIENGEAWRCQECGALNKDDESLCKECGYAPNAWLCSCGAYIEEACHCENCGAQAPWGCDCGLRNDIELQDEEQDKEELEYMPIEMTIGRYEFLAPWEDVYERDDSEGWHDEP